MIRIITYGLSVCYYVFGHHEQWDNKRAIPKGSALHWLDYEFGEFRKSTAFKTYGVKTNLNYDSDWLIMDAESKPFFAKFITYYSVCLVRMGGVH